MCTFDDFAQAYGSERLIRPPATTLFHQVLAYLRSKPNPAKRPSGTMAGREGVAAAALTLRWGSYLAVLLDRNKPVWSKVGTANTSRISDDEMARINIEATAALADWIDLYREDPRGPMYEQLVNRAVAYLPMPKKTAKLTITTFATLCEPEMATRVIDAASASRSQHVVADVERFPSRVFANAVVNSAWRNGPVEDVHAGRFCGYPLDQRRATPTEERKLMAFASEGLALSYAGILVTALGKGGGVSWR